MSSDIELFRAFGSVNGATAVQAIKEDYARIASRISNDPKLNETQKAAELLKFQKNSLRYQEMFESLLLRVRGLWGLQQGRGDLATRAGRLFLNWNVATMMGMVTISSVSDIHRSVTAYGLTNTLRHAWVPYLKAFVSKESREGVRAQMQYLRLLNIGVDVKTGARARALMELMAPDPYMSRGERAMEQISASMPLVAAFGYWTDAMKMLTGSVTLGVTLDVLDRAAGGKIKPHEVTALAAGGLDEPMIRRIWSAMNDPKGADEVGGVKVPNTEFWEDRGAARALEAWLSRESDRLIISPGLERPLWSDKSIGGRVITQFRSFMFSSNSKATIAAAQARDPHEFMRVFNGFASSMALGAISYYLWALTSGDDAWDEMQNATWEEWADQAMMRSGYLGALGEIQNIGTQIPLTADYVSFSGAPFAGRRTDDLISAFAGPTFGKIGDIAQVLQGIDEPTQGTVNTARKLVPYQNVAYLKEVFEQIEQAVNSTFNLPEKRS